MSRRNYLLGLLAIVVAIGLSTFAITQAINSTKEVKTVVKEVVVTPVVATPSAVLSPTVNLRKGLTIPATKVPQVTTGTVAK